MIGKDDRYQYRADFIHEGTLILHLVRNQLIKASELDPYPIRMLQQHGVPHMLKPNVRIMNEEASLHYEISGKRLLLPLLAVEKISELQYYEWLLQLIGIVEHCRAYMLQPNQILFHEDVLFIEGELQGGKLYIPYIPIVEPLDPHAAIRGLQKLAISLSGQVKQWSGNGFQELIRLLYQEDVSYALLRNHVQTYMVPKPQIDGSPDWQAEQMIHPINRSKAIVTMMHEPASLGSDSGHLSSENGWGELQTDAEEGRVEELHDLDRDLELQPQSWVIAGGIAALISAAGLKLGYGQSANGIGITISLLFVVIGVSVGYIWRTGWGMLWIQRVLRRNKARLPADDTFIPDMASVELTSFMSKRSNPNKTRAQIEHPTDHQAKHQVKYRVKKTAVDDDYLYPSVAGNSGAGGYSQLDTNLEQSLSAQTTLLDDSGSATILLDDCAQPVETVRVVLERLISGRVTEVFEVNQFPFAIGRSEQGVQLTISEPGISKLHCELHYDLGQYWIKDLGSKNGTVVRGELLIPYKKTLITMNDIIKLVHSEYRFANV